MPTDHSTPDFDARAAMSGDHTRLARLFDDLLNAFEGDAQQACAALWTQFDSGLRRHFELEERYILPYFRADHPEEAEALQREHAQILTKLETLGIGVDLHLTRAEVVADFVHSIRQHAEREDQLLYAWTQGVTEEPHPHRSWAWQVRAAIDKLIAHAHHDAAKLTRGSALK
ncbi:MAG: hemerythrin domain-containing protein [Polyangiales bacterium]